MKAKLAQHFAHEAHDSIKQVRKYITEPYWVHTDAVAALVATVTDDDEVIAAAHLHDVEEDVAPHHSIIHNPEWYGLPADGVYYYDVTAIAAIFGARVAKLVLDLTDQFTHATYPHWNRKRRKAAEVERLKTADIAAKTIKLADLIDNTSSIVPNDPDFARVYLREKLDLLPVLSEGNAGLLQRASMQAVIGLQSLGVNIPMMASPV